MRSASLLTPIPINWMPTHSQTHQTRPRTMTTTSEVGTFRGRMEQQVNAIAESANKVISGVVGVLRLFAS
jgi:hypothetical protein